MIHSQRQQIMEILARLSELTPDVRFGQLIANLSYRAVAATTVAISDMADEQLVSAIQTQIADLSDGAANIPYGI